MKTLHFRIKTPHAGHKFATETRENYKVLTGHGLSTFAQAFPEKEKKGLVTPSCTSMDAEGGLHLLTEELKTETTYFRMSLGQVREFDIFVLCRTWETCPSAIVVEVVVGN